MSLNYYFFHFKLLSNILPDCEDSESTIQSVPNL